MPIKSKERNRQGHCYPTGMEVGQNRGLIMSDGEKVVAKISVGSAACISISFSSVFMGIGEDSSAGCILDISGPFFLCPLLHH